MGAAVEDSSNSKSIASPFSPIWMRLCIGMTVPPETVMLADSEAVLLKLI